MKHILILLASLMMMNATPDTELRQLWKSYDKAAGDDLPKEQLAILEKIKSAALEANAPWDYYDACSKYRQVRISVNWKERNAALETFDKEIDGCGMPVAYFYKHRSEDIDIVWQYVKDNASTLQAGRNEKFYSDDRQITSPIFGPVLQELLADDLDYARWNLFLRTGEKKYLEGSADGKYPQEAFAQWREMNYNDREASLKEYAARYDGKAVSLFARQELLQRRFEALETDGKGVSSDYKDLAEDCRALEKTAAAFSGSEKKIADCCTVASGLLKTLEAQEIELEVLDSRLTADVRNLAEIKVTVTDSKDAKVYETTLHNKVRSFYAADSLYLTLPDFDDGDYKVKAVGGTAEDETPYRKYTLSLALKHDAQGWWSYAADYKSGEPVSGCEQGFKALPQGFSARSYQASVTDGGRKRLSPVQQLSRYDSYDDLYTDTSSLNCRILTDRKAFRPGETLNFKVIAWRGTTEIRPAGERLDLKATLYGADGKELDSQDLTTGEFSSAAGSFVLTRCSKNGGYTLQVSSGGKVLENCQVTVEDYVLPTFEIRFDRQDRFWLPGDTICVKGSVLSYSGHTLGAAKMTYTVQRDGENISEFPLAAGQDGSFSISFDAGDKEYGYFTVTVKVTDATGETIENSAWEYVGENSLSCEMTGPAEGSYNGEEGCILASDTLQVLFRSKFNELNSIGYTIKKDGKTVRTGTAAAGEAARIDFKGMPSGEYSFEAVSAATDRLGGVHNSRDSFSFYKISDSDKNLSGKVEEFFREIEGDRPALQVGTTEGKAWVVVELYDSEEAVLLDRKMLRLGGSNPNLRTASFDWKNTYPESVSLKAFFFHNKEVYSYETTKERKVSAASVPLEFTRFSDITAPGKKYVFAVRTAPDTECAVTIFDKSTETIHDNTWTVFRPFRMSRSVTNLYRCGENGYENLYHMVRGSMRLNSAKSAAFDMDEIAPMAYAMEETSIGSVPGEDLEVRDDFASTVAWEPFLRSDAEGNAEIEFTSGDKLSTFFVQVFAHDRSMRNATVRREMKVTVPVKVSVMEPQFLYAGDNYTAMATLSSNAPADVSGTASIIFYDGKDYRTAGQISRCDRKVTVPAGGAYALSLPLEVPEVENLGVMVSFAADNADYAGDAMFVSIPVSKPFQTVSEAHSALLKAGADKDSLIAALRSLFVNADGSKAGVREISIRQMIQEAIPQKFSCTAKDPLGCSESLYAGILARRIGSEGLSDSQRDELVRKIMDCRSQDGGFSWMPGFKSSPIITASLLLRFTIDRSLFEECIAPAVQYLDKSFFEMREKPIWYGRLSMEQYMYVRSFYPDVEFNVKTDKEFKTAAKDYLVPAGARGLNGQTFAKARRLATLGNLGSSDEGLSLAKAWGVRLGTKARIRKSVDKDVNSLVQYAVEHSSGGYYFPNAVMPWRGLLESELHAHTVLCALMDEYGHGDIAEGIRLWIMVQKETQKWSDDPGFIDALDCVLKAGEETLSTEVIALEASALKHFDDVKAYGNGISLEVSGVTEATVGDRVTRTYKVRSEENRSFAVLSVPHCAALRPVDQKSGIAGWNVYRNVLADRTEYWFEVLPEEEFEITEDFYITQQGSFRTPASDILSRYAPHYCAGSASVPVTVTRINTQAE